MKRACTLSGLWRIVDMDLWDRDAIDLVGPAFIEFGPNGTGQFRFIAVDGQLDHRDAEPGNPRIEFTWNGTDDGDRVSGRGWAEHDVDMIRGHIYFHDGDDSGFRATKQKSPLA
jgi:hypothetical protein